MEKSVLACIDGQSLAMPSLIGFDDERIDALPWIACETSAQACRERAAGLPSSCEAWVVSCDDMEPINVAAAIKGDDPSRKVFLVADGQSGSLASRAANARIDGLLSQAELIRRYASAKAACASSCVSGEDCNARGKTVGAISQDSHAAGRARQAGEGAGSEGLRASLPTLGPSEASGAQGDGRLRDGMSPAGEAGCLSVEGACDGRSAPAEAQGGGPAALHASRASAPDRGVAPAASPRFSAMPPVEYRAKGSPAKEGSGTAVAVVSGSGGCGKSTLSAVFCLVAAEAGLRVAALDADLQFGDLDYLLGVQEPLRIEDAARDPGRLTAATQAAPQDAPVLVAAPSRLEVSETVAGQIAPMVRALKESFDLVVVNTGAFWSDGHAGVLETADAVAFVMDSRPSSLRATVHAVELCSRLGAATTGFVFAVNRHTRTSLLSGVDVSCALRGAKAVELPDGGRDVDELLGAGYPGELLESRNPFVDAARAFLREMLPPRRAELLAAKGPSKRRRRSFFGRGDAR